MIYVEYLIFTLITMIRRQTSLEDIDDEEEIEEYESDEDADANKEVAKTNFALIPSVFSLICTPCFL